MLRRLRQIFYPIALVLVAACGTPPAAVTPTATSAPVAVPPTAAAATAVPTVAATAAATAVATAVPPTPALSATAAPSAPLPPTATAIFPEARITEAALARLQPLRSIGFGAAVDAAIGPDNRLLAVATTAGLALFELPGLRHLRFDSIGGGAQDVGFGDDGQTLTVVTGGAFHPQETQVRRVADGALISTAPAEASAKPLKVVSPDGQLQAQFNVPDSSPTPGVRLTRVAGEQLIYEDTLSERAAFSSDSRLIALVAYDGTLRLLDANGAIVDTLELLAYWSVVFSPDGQSMVTAGRAAWLWDVVTSEQRQKLEGLALAAESWVTAAQQRASFSPDGSILTVEGSYSGFEASVLRGSAWKLTDAGAVHAWDSDAGGAGITNFETYAGAISPATDAVARTDDGVALEVHQGGQKRYTLQVPQRVGALAFSPDGALLAVGDKAGQVQLVQAGDGAIVRKLEGPAALTVLQFSPDRALLGARVADGRLLVWSLAEGKLLREIMPSEASPPHDLVRRDPFIFMPDGTLLIASEAGSVRFYRVSDGQLLHQIEGSAENMAIGPRQRLLGLVRGGRVELWGIP